MLQTHRDYLTSSVLRNCVHVSRRYTWTVDTCQLTKYYRKYFKNKFIETELYQI